MLKYEGLFILDAGAREDSLKRSIEKIQKEIEQIGGRIDKVQKMDQRPFARRSRRRTSGYYVNFVFDAPPETIGKLDAKFRLEGDVFRWQFTRAPLEESGHEGGSSHTAKAHE